MNLLVSKRRNREKAKKRCQNETNGSETSRAIMTTNETAEMTTGAPETAKTEESARARTIHEKGESEA
jgi:hypothetical protein